MVIKVMLQMYEYKILFVGIIVFGACAVFVFIFVTRLGLFRLFPRQDYNYFALGIVRFKEIYQFPKGAANRGVMELGNFS